MTAAHAVSARELQLQARELIGIAENK